MPSIARISNTFFTSLLNRLGIRPPFAEGWEISNVVQPVSLVDADIPITAIATSQVLDAPATQGIIAPSLNQNLAQTAAVSVDGDYKLYLLLAINWGGGPPDCALERVNSGGTTVWSQLLVVPNAGTISLGLAVRLRAGDFIRIKKIVNADTGRYQASLWIS
jgi:hypothetical protein